MWVSCQSPNFLHGVTATHWECLVNRLFFSLMSMVLIVSVLSIVYLYPWYYLGVTCHSSFYLHVVTATNLECLVNRPFVSMVSIVLIGNVFLMVFLSPYCHSYSLGASCQSSIYLYGVTVTHWECHVSRLFISMVSKVLIWSVLSIVSLYPWCPWYPLGVFVNRLLSIVSMVLNGSVNHLFISVVSRYCPGVYCQSSIYLHGVTATHWECLVNRLVISMVSVVLIGSVLSIIYLSPWCHGYSLGVYRQSSIISMVSMVLPGSVLSNVYLLRWCQCWCQWCPFRVFVNRLFLSMVSMVLNGIVLSIIYLSPWCHGTHWECIGNSLIISMVSVVLIGSVLSIIYLSPWCHGYSLGVYRRSSFISMVSVVLLGSVLSNVYLLRWCQCYSLAVSCQSSIYLHGYLHGVKGTHWECFVIVYLSQWCQGYSFVVPYQLSIYFYGVNVTHWEFIVNRLFIVMASMVLIASV